MLHLVLHKGHIAYSVEGTVSIVPHKWQNKKSRPREYICTAKKKKEKTSEQGFKNRSQHKNPKIRNQHIPNNNNNNNKIKPELKGRGRPESRNELTNKKWQRSGLEWKGLDIANWHGVKQDWVHTVVEAASARG